MSEEAWPPPGTIHMGKPARGKYPVLEMNQSTLTRLLDQQPNFSLDDKIGLVVFILMMGPAGVGIHVVEDMPDDSVRVRTE